MIYYDDGSIFEGDLVNRVPHGLGLMEWSNGDIYAGEWKKGEIDRYGIYYWGLLKMNMK
jgi:hypothetical protein